MADKGKSNDDDDDDGGDDDDDNGGNCDFDGDVHGGADGDGGAVQVELRKDCINYLQTRLFALELN